MPLCGKDPDGDNCFSVASVSIKSTPCFDGISSMIERRQGSDNDQESEKDQADKVEVQDKPILDVDRSIDEDEPTSFGSRCCCRRARPQQVPGVIQAIDLHMKDIADTTMELLPLGAGCSGDQELSQELRDLRHKAVQMYERKFSGAELTYFQSGWLTAETLQHYDNPPVPHKLVKALRVRGQREEVFTRQTIWLNGSLRVVGHDLEGTSILSWESITMRKSFSHYMDHAELLIHLALDMNRPGSHGWIHITDYYGWNPLLFLNPAPMARFASWVEGQFRRRLKMAVFVDMPYGASGMLNFMLNFLKPATRSKIRICTFDEFLTLLGQTCDAETAQRIEAYFRNRREGTKVKQHWHPIIDLPWFREKLGYLNFDGDEKTTLSPGELKLFREHIKTWHHQHWPRTPRGCLPSSTLLQQDP